MTDIKSIDIAAALYGCSACDLMKVRYGKDGEMVVIAPTGQKFVYPKEEVDGKRKELEAKVKPKQVRTKPKAKRKAAPKTRRVPTPKVERKPAVSSRESPKGSDPVH